MKLFNLSFDKVLWRFYLMMTMVIVPFFIGVPYLAILAVAVFLSVLLGVTFEPTKDYTRSSKESALYTKNSSKAA